MRTQTIVTSIVNMKENHENGSKSPDCINRYPNTAQRQRRFKAENWNGDKDRSLSLTRFILLKTYFENAIVWMLVPYPKMMWSCSL